MKNILTYVFLLPFWLGVHAQNYSTSSQVDLVLSEVNTLKVNHSNVDLAMNQASHFIGGNATPLQENHVQVSSTSGYKVTIQTEQVTFDLNATATDLPVAHVKVEVGMGDNISRNPGNAMDIAFSTGINLQSTPVEVLQSPSGSFSQGFHVRYSIPASVTADFMDREAGDYSVQVRYTLVQD